MSARDFVTTQENQQDNDSTRSVESKSSKKSKENSSSSTSLTSNSNLSPRNESEDKQNGEEEACVVCFKAVGIYSIGECDHPVCYECSTRMRVLCQQNECPICRQVLSKVIFTYEKLPYRELESKNRSEFYSKKYMISFNNSAIQQKFFKLLDHPCPVCNCQPYRTFRGLQNHVREKHNLHYCDLCTNNLKIFTFERRCYTKSELGLHLTKGDADNRSHRGHPLCEYCNQRYLDRDELFRHLRREHYFCHFCDADGCNEFYKDYKALAEHFREDHYLCEEGRCATEEFIGAFRTEIDYKAHVANVHGKTLNKLQAKQTRTLQLEITLGPRGRSGQNDQHLYGVRSRRGPAEQYHDEPPEYAASQLNHQQDYDYNPTQQRQQPLVIDAASEQEFPALAGASNAPNVSLVRPPPPSMRNRSGISGLARTKENFPELGSSGGGGTVKPSTSNQTSGPPISALMKKAPPTSTNNSTKPSGSQSKNAHTPMVIHVSNRPASSSGNNGNNKNKNQLDFPALPSSGKSKKGAKILLDEDSLPSTSNPLPLANVSAKHRPLINEYVSVANPNNFHKIQMIQKEEAEAKAKAAAALELTKAPKLTAHDFPSLGPAAALSSNSTNNGTKNNLNNWTKPISEKKQRDLENRKSKVAPAPQLTNNNKQQQQRNLPDQNISTSAVATNASNNKNKDKKQKEKEKEKEKKQSNEMPSNEKTKTNSKEKLNGKNNSTTNNNNNNNNNESKALNLNSNQSKESLKSVGSNNSMRPPPGFNSQHALNPPPGFQTNVTVNSVAKSPNNLTFTSSLGESYSIIPAHVYRAPPDSPNRNQILVNHFKDSLDSTEALEEFRFISQRFKEGSLKPQAYYDHCESALKNNFDKIFPELLALLPDINKQQSLYLVHQQRVNSLPQNQRKSLPKFEVCSNCKQVLLPNDAKNHRDSHLIDENFPSLDKSGANPNRK